MLWRSHEKIIALGALLLMSPRLGLRNSLGRFGAGLPSTPKYTLSCSVTLGQPGITGRSVALQRGPVSPAGTSALGAVDNKTMHGVVMKLSMDLTYYKFQANDRTPQCVSITNTVLCIQKSRINIYQLWTNHYFRHYKILKINLFVFMGGNIFIFDWSYTLSRIPRGCRSNTPKM